MFALVLTEVPSLFNWIYFFVPVIAVLIITR